MTVPPLSCILAINGGQYVRKQPAHALANISYLLKLRLQASTRPPPLVLHPVFRAETYYPNNSYDGATKTSHLCSCVLQNCFAPTYPTG